MEKCVGCNFGCKAFTEAKAKGENAWKCKIGGIWCFKNLPQGMRLANLEDINPDGRRIIGLRYLLLSQVSGIYETYTLHEDTDLPNLMRFVYNDRCWVKEST